MANTDEADILARHRRMMIFMKPRDGWRLPPSRRWMANIRFKFFFTNAARRFISLLFADVPELLNAARARISTAQLIR